MLVVMVTAADYSSPIMMMIMICHDILSSYHGIIQCEGTTSDDSHGPRIDLFSPRHVT
jgi:hypothetical protein